MLLDNEKMNVPENWKTVPRYFIGTTNANGVSARRNALEKFTLLGRHEELDRLSSICAIDLFIYMSFCRLVRSKRG